MSARPALIPLVTARPMVRPTYTTTKENIGSEERWVWANTQKLLTYWDQCAEQLTPAEREDVKPDDFHQFCGQQYDAECIRWEKAQPHGDVIYGCDSDDEEDSAAHFAREMSPSERTFR